MLKEPIPRGCGLHESEVGLFATIDDNTVTALLRIRLSLLKLAAILHENYASFGRAAQSLARGWYHYLRREFDKAQLLSSKHLQAHLLGVQSRPLVPRSGPAPPRAYGGDAI